MINWEYLHNLILETKNVQFKSKGICEHHVLPKHAGGTNDPDNLILLPYRYHVLIHYIRWRWLKQSGDLIAYRFMINFPIPVSQIPEIYDKIVAAANTPENKKKKSLRMKKLHSDQVFHDSCRQRIVDYNNNLTESEKIEKIKFLSSPEIRKKAQETRKKNPKYLEILHESIKNARRGYDRKIAAMTDSERKDFFNRGELETHIAWKGSVKLINDNGINFIFYTTKEFLKLTKIHRSTFTKFVNTDNPIRGFRSKWKGFKIYRNKDILNAIICNQ